MQCYETMSSNMINENLRQTPRCLRCLPTSCSLHFPSAPLSTRNVMLSLSLLCERVHSRQLGATVPSCSSRYDGSTGGKTETVSHELQQRWWRLSPRRQGTRSGTQSELTFLAAQVLYFRVSPLLMLCSTVHRWHEVY